MQSQDVLSLRVGDRTFLIPSSSISKLDNWQFLPVEHGIQTIHTRDAHIFSFIHRWLCGYPPHLPEQEWEIMCLLHDCDFFGTPELKCCLIEMLHHQTNNFGRKSRFLMSNQQLLEQFDLDSPWEDIIGFWYLRYYKPILKQTLDNAVKILEASKKFNYKLASPLIAILSENDQLCIELLLHITRDMGILLPEPMMLSVMSTVLIDRLAIILNPPFQASASPADSQEEGEDEKEKEEASKFKHLKKQTKRTIPPPTFKF